MSLDLHCYVHLNAVIHLIHEHTNRPLVQALPRFYTNCPVDVVKKENGMYAFINAEKPVFQVRIQLPQYLTETLELSADFQDKVQVVRCSPVPKSVLGAPPANTTYFCGTGMTGEKIYLQCPVRYCQIRINKILPDGRALFESTNFLFAGTGRCLLLKDKNENCELVHTIVEKEYTPNRFFLSENPLQKITSEKDVTVVPVFCTRADAEGHFLAAAEDVEDGTGFLLYADGTKRQSFLYQAGGRVMLS